MKQTSYPMMHVSLYVSDIAKTVKFYTDFFNQEASKVKSAYAKFVLKEPSLVISFVQDPSKVKQNFGHLGFMVGTQEDLKAKLEAVQKSGISHLEEMQTSCCYALQDKFWVADPDGIQWEVYYFHHDVEFNDPHYELEKSACCSPDENVRNSTTQAETCC